MTPRSMHTDDSEQPAREELNEFLAATHENESAEFEVFCDERPGLAVALRKLYMADRRIKDQFILFGDGQLDATVSPAMDSGSTAEQLEALVSELDMVSPPDSRYQIGAELARGGMGAILKVWDKSLRRTLAMKVALGAAGATGTERPSAAANRTLARFLDEAHITGQLDHPGIVPVHELGVDANGRVYFTMRLVKGRTLSEVFDLVKRSKDGWTEARALGVLLKVCEAMAYAHSKQVIHRDLKPANIMVGRFGEVYVMDWGLARVQGKHDPRDIRIRATDTVRIRAPRGKLHDQSPDSPLVTMDGDVVGTPVYMSPEQARGDIAAMGPHSDVYALGAMLYQLLTGTRPYLIPGVVANKYAIWQRVQEGAPKPVHVLSPTASAEICSICEKAMARETGDRYPDMSALAEDLSAYIEGRVVRAHETGAWAETKKWVTRNRALATAISAAVLLLVVGLGSALWLRGEALASAALADKNAQERTEQANLARVNQEEAQRQASVALAISEFLNKDLLGAIDPNLAKHSDVSLRNVVDQASNRINNKFPGQPAVEAQLRQTLGLVYNQLGASEEAIEHLEHALRLFAEVESEESLSVAASLFELAIAWGNGMGDYDRATELARRSLDIRVKELGPEDELTVLTAGDVALYEALGNGDAWAPMESPGFDYVFAFSAKSRGLKVSPDEMREVWMRDLARMGTAWGEGDRETARRILYRTAKPFAEQPLLRDRVTWAGIAMARYLHLGGADLIADSLGTLCVDFAIQQFGEDNSWTANTVTLLGSLRRSQGRLEEAQACALRSFAIYRRIAGNDHDDTRRSLHFLARTHEDAGHPEQAERFLREYLAELEGREGLEETRATILNDLAHALDRIDPFAPAALELTHRASELIQGKRFASRELKADLLLRSGRFHLHESDMQPARQDLVAAWALLEHHKKLVRTRREVLQALVELYGTLDRPEERETYRALLQALEESDIGRMNPE